jgi:hypothetical protein
MPWRHTSPMDQNPQCIADDLRDRLARTERCALDGISRKTADPWIDRDLTHGPHGLEERSRRPRTAPRHTPDPVVAAILDARRRQPSWGAKQLGSLLSPRYPCWPWPARATIGDLLSRPHLAPKRRQRHAIGHPGPPTSARDAPHDVWSADFTGPCQTGDGRSGSPLTIADGDRRLRLACAALSSTRVQAATPVFRRGFTAFGLPQRLRPAHGVPCATNTLARLSRWSATSSRNWSPRPRSCAS